MRLSKKKFLNFFKQNLKNERVEYKLLPKKFQSNGNTKGVCPQIQKLEWRNHLAIAWPGSKRLNNKQKACGSWRHHFMVWHKAKRTSVGSLELLNFTWRYSTVILWYVGCWLFSPLIKPLLIETLHDRWDEKHLDNVTCSCIQPFPTPNLSKILQLYEKDKLLLFTIIYIHALRVHTFSSISFLLPLKPEESLPCKGHQPTKNFHHNYWHPTHHSVLSKQPAKMVIYHQLLLRHIIHS